MGKALKNVKGGDVESAAATKEGLLTVPAGVKVLRLVPPLIVSAAEAAKAVTKLEAAMAACIADAK